jgi:DNA invertase Pin-like site-specific DNA recombinase
MAIIGYVRVSTQEQNEDRQLTIMEQYKVEKVFSEKLSGKNTERPELKRMIEYVREGDTLVIESYSRLARSTKDLVLIVEQLNAKDVNLISSKENIDTNTPQGRFMFTIFAGLAEFERECTLQRQAEGIAEAKKKGLYKGRKPKPYDEKQLRIECEKWRREEQTATAIMRKLDMSSNRFYRIVNRLGIGKRESEK